MIRWLLHWWWARQRRIDIEMLWPACKAAAISNGSDLQHAKAAFAFHAYHDPAWCKFYSPQELRRQIDNLE
jgi:hypothetical protein